MKKPARRNVGAKPGASEPDPGGGRGVRCLSQSRYRAKLLALRRLILDTAKMTKKAAGALQESLKWGQPSYLTTETKSGSTVRIDQVKAVPGQVAIYFHCQTDLVATFRELYPELRYGGNRSILLNAEDKLPEAELRHCVGLALTYHLRKKAGRG